jgi:hypothetical protein
VSVGELGEVPVRTLTIGAESNRPDQSLGLWFARSFAKTAVKTVIAAGSELSILGQKESKRSRCTWLKTQGRGQDFPSVQDAVLNVRARTRDVCG